MATLLQLVEGGNLVRFDPRLGMKELQERCIYLSTRSCDWMAETLPTLSSTWNIAETPQEQASALLSDFCAGIELGVTNDLRPLKPAGNGIWELKSADLRFFGWFPYKDHLVVTDCNHAELVKVHKLYHGYCNAAVHFRENLALDEPKFLTGIEANDVVSNWYFS